MALNNLFNLNIQQGDQNWQEFFGGGGEPSGILAAINPNYASSIKNAIAVQKGTYKPDSTWNSFYQLNPQYHSSNKSTTEGVDFTKTFSSYKPSGNPYDLYLGNTASALSYGEFGLNPNAISLGQLDLKNKVDAYNKIVSAPLKTDIGTVLQNFPEAKYWSDQTLQAFADNYRLGLASIYDPSRQYNQANPTLQSIVDAPGEIQYRFQGHKYNAITDPKQIKFDPVYGLVIDKQYKTPAKDHSTGLIGGFVDSLSSSPLPTLGLLASAYFGLPATGLGETAGTAAGAASAPTGLASLPTAGTAAASSSSITDWLGNVFNKGVDKFISDPITNTLNLVGGVPKMIDSIIDSVGGSSTTGSTEGFDLSGWGLDNGGSLSGSDDWGDVIDTITSLPEVKIPNISIEDAWNSGVGSINTGGVGLTVPTTPTIPDSSGIPITGIPVTSTQRNNMWDFDSWWNEGITNALGGISSEGLSFDPSKYSTNLNLLSTLGAGITGVGNYTNPNISLGDPSSYINTVLGNLSSGNLSNYTIPTTGSDGSPLSQGVTAALSKLLEGGINKFMEDPVKNALTVYSGLTSASDQKEFAKQLKNLMSSGLQQSDPFGSQRAYYMDRLKNTYTNPEGYLKSPEYSAISKRRLEALERADAAQGRRSQYGARTEKMHEFDLENLNKERTMLAQLAGSGINPSQVSSLLGSLGIGSAQAQANAPGNLLFMLNEIFGGKK